MAHLKYGRTEKSCVAQHAFDNNHRIDINNLKLIRSVTNSRQLDAFESLEIKCNSSMNKDKGSIPTSPLFALINKDKCSGSKYFGESILSRTQVFEWHKAFSEGREVVENLPHASHPSTSVNDNNIEKVKEIVLENRRVSLLISV
ncbi:hypothetical protein NQ318_012234 [Aromia moschata]|uniref:Uncharacterized protein n=1 Tax=Aromia moschata TaxID=1265417 RepID=A0AAV8YJA2_9CUCU|nr:hypothetical protein NQ318_012234 [Aromia moschata]